MNQLKPNRFRRRLIVSFAVTGVLASTASGSAQSVLVAPPVLPAEEMEPVLQRPDPNQVAGEGSSIESSAPSGAIPARPQIFFQWGPIRLRPHLSYQFLSATGIQTAPGESAKLITHTFSPAMLFELGSHWTLDYVPSFRFFSDNRFRNTLDQSVNLTGATAFQDWTLGLSQGFSHSDEPQFETGSQIQEDAYSARLNAAYHFAAKMSVEADVNAGLNFVGHNAAAQQLSDTRDYSMTDWINYQWHPKLGLGLGVTGGYSDQTGGFETVYERILGRITCHPGRKLTFSMNGGLEDRQFIGSDQADAVNPILDLSLQYQLFQRTALTLNASRAVSVSLFTDQITESTQINAGLSQRLFGKLDLTLGAGYTNAKYKSNSTQSTPDRTDDITSVNVGLGLHFLKHGSFETFYQYSHDASTQSGFSFSSNQAGVTITWAY